MFPSWCLERGISASSPGDTSPYARSALRESVLQKENALVVCYGSQMAAQVLRAAEVFGGDYSQQLVFVARWRRVANPADGTLSSTLDRLMFLYMKNNTNVK